MDNNKEEQLYAEFKDLSQLWLDEAFKKACKDNDLDKVKFLLTSPRLEKHANIHYRDYQGFIFACICGHLEIVKYLMTSPDLTFHASVHSDSGQGLISASKGGHLELVKYLLTSPDLDEHADIHANYDAVFCGASERDNFEVIKFLIFEMNIEKTKYIKTYLEDYPNERIENMFKIRELNQQLESELPSKMVQQNKIKL